MNKCLRCGKCCFYEVDGYVKRCKYLVDTSDGKTMCRIYSRRIGKIIDAVCGKIVVCGFRKNQKRFIPNCPLNTIKVTKLHIVPPTKEE